MRPVITLLVLAVALVTRAASASADIITIEPDAFAPGTDVTHISPGVTLSTITAQDPLSVIFTPTYVKQNPLCLTGGPCDAVTGSQGFSPNPDGFGTLIGEYGNANALDLCAVLILTGAPGGPFPPCQLAAGQSALWMEFDAGADFVEIAGVWTSDFLWVKAYDENYQTVDVRAVPDVVLPGGGDFVSGTKGYSTLTAPEGNIKYVIAGSVGGVAGLDVIRYRAVAVPEPSTLLLCGVGFIGLLCSRRRSRD